MNYVDMDGVENVAVNLIKQARKDYIKGAKILLLKMKRIPSLDECYKVSYGQAIKHMCDSWRFVINDPYSIFGDIGEDSIIKDWQNSAMMDIYRDLNLQEKV